MEKKTFYERYKDETLSDNSKVENCKQCKDCIFWNNHKSYSHYTKGECEMYKIKPLHVIKNKGVCEYRNTGEDIEEDNKD